MTGFAPSKTELRTRVRAQRRAYADALPEQVRALVFHRPPRPVLDLVPEGATVGLYHAGPGEAPTGGYARFFAERGHPIALPWFAGRDAPMQFRRHVDPFAGADLVPGPFGPQPEAAADEAIPDTVFVPLLAFTNDGHRLGQGGGHYDRWLAMHPEALPIGLAWDMQELAELPREAHDMPLHAVVTPTRVIGPFR